MSPCPSEQQLGRLLAGEAGEEDLRFLEPHVTSCSACDATLEKLAGADEAARWREQLARIPTIPWPPPGPASEAAAMPAKVGKYLVVKKLAEEGQAAVYVAIHPGLAKEVVLKISRLPLAAGRPERDLLVQEGQVLAGLRHPNLVAVHDLDIHEGRPYLVLDYVPGKNLEQAAAAIRFAPGAAAALAAKVARAVALVHSRGILHLDIKPRNILIDEEDEPRLIDFGIAQMRDAWSEPPTGTGGTPAYLAPEQARAMGAGPPDAPRTPPDERSDVFSLGAVLYFLLAGQAPFQGKDKQQCLDRAARADFDASALRANGVPPRLVAICLRAMAASPGDRYARAEDLAADLERFARGSRQLAWLAAAAAVLAAGAAVAWGLGWLGPARTTDGFRVLSLEVVHYLRRGQQDFRLGALGPHSHAAAFGDSVQVEARLSEPAYCYLVAFNPDGKDQLCFPARDKPPVRVRSLSYPLDRRSGFRLTDGVGQQAFVLIASRKPLPAYADWKARGAPLPWRTVAAEGVWSYAGRDVEQLDRHRGPIDRLNIAPFEELCRSLRQRPGVESMAAVAFPVRKKDEEKAP